MVWRIDCVIVTSNMNATTIQTNGTNGNGGYSFETKDAFILMRKKHLPYSPDKPPRGLSKLKSQFGILAPKKAPPFLDI